MERMDSLIEREVDALFDRAFDADFEAVFGNGTLGETMTKLPQTTHFRARPMMTRLQRRWAGREVGPPTDEERADAIKVLAEGFFADKPGHDPLYAEAERMLDEYGQ